MGSPRILAALMGSPRILAALSLLLSHACEAFVLPPTAGCLPHTHGRCAAAGRWGGGIRTLAAQADGGDDGGKALFESLRARQAQLKEEEKTLLSRWRSGECASKAALFLDDYVRRISLDWPLVGLGSAGGGVYVADCNTGELVATTSSAPHPDYIPTAEADMDMRLLHGDYDGGGVTAVAFSLSNSLLVSGGRDGRALVWEFDLDKKDLSLKATLQCGARAVSAIAVCPDALGGYSSIWTSSLDNTIRRWDKTVGPDGSPSFAQAVKHDMGSPVLCLALDHERERLLAGTADGHAVALHLSAESSAPLADSPPASVIHRWRPHTGARTRCVAVGHGCAGEGEGEGEEDAGGYVVTGGSDGAIALVKLAPDGSFPDKGAEQALQPNHNGQVVALKPQGPLLISGAQDGTMRIWDMSTRSIKERMREPPVDGPRCLYGLGGYKVWLGSIETDGTRLVSDGADNKIVVHDFSPAAVALDDDL